MHINKILNFVKIFYFYLAFVGIFGFALFIAEESMQVMMWGNFAAQDAGRYDIVKRNIETIENINKTFEKINRCCMWINPFQFWGYGAWSEGTLAYTSSLQALILAREPSLYDGERVSIQFHWKRYEQVKNGYYAASNGKVKIFFKEKPVEKTIFVSGVVRINPSQEDGVIIIAE